MQYFADHHTIGPGASIFNVFYLKARHGQGIGQSFGR
jgi:hypothetical protein